MDKSIAQLIAIMFLSRDLAHREHLRVSGSGAYAAHMALGSFYEAITDIADELTETYQGAKNQIIEKIPLLAHKGSEDIIQILQSHVDWIQSNRYEAIPREDTPLQNIVDEGVALYWRTLYKLRNLK